MVRLAALPLPAVVAFLVYVGLTRNDGALAWRANDHSAEESTLNDPTGSTGKNSERRTATIGLRQYRQRQQTIYQQQHEQEQQSNAFDERSRHLEEQQEEENDGSGGATEDDDDMDDSVLQDELKTSAPTPADAADDDDDHAEAMQDDASSSSAVTYPSTTIIITTPPPAPQPTTPIASPPQTAPVPVRVPVPVPATVPVPVSRPIPKSTPSPKGGGGNTGETSSPTTSSAPTSLSVPTLFPSTFLEKISGSKAPPPPTVMSSSVSSEPTLSPTKTLLNSFSNSTTTNGTEDSELDGDCPVIEPEPVPLPEGYVGIVKCPMPEGTTATNKNITGYAFWSDLVHDVNHLLAPSSSSALVDAASIALFTLCPHREYDASTAANGRSNNMHVQQSNVEIACGTTGLPQGCLVRGASIRIAANLTGIVLRGVEFVALEREIRIDETATVRLAHCRFSDTLFGGTKDFKRAAVVSSGFLHIADCLFASNVGQGAVLITANTALVERSQFRHNKISPAFMGTLPQYSHTDDAWAACASAIQVGISNDTNVLVNDNNNTLSTTNNNPHNRSMSIAIRDSCFDNNYGPHIVRLQPGATLSVNRRNAVYNTIGNATCNGAFIYRTNSNNNGQIDPACERFAFRNSSCADHASIGALSDLHSTKAPSQSPIVAAEVVTDDNNDEEDVSDDAPLSDDDFGFPSNETVVTDDEEDDDASDDGNDEESDKDDDDTDDKADSSTENDDDETWLDELIDTLGDTNSTTNTSSAGDDDAIVPLTDASLDFDWEGTLSGAAMTRNGANSSLLSLFLLLLSTSWLVWCVPILA